MCVPGLLHCAGVSCQDVLNKQTVVIFPGPEVESMMWAAS